MSARSGQRLARTGYWKIIRVPTEDDLCLLGRQLPTPDAKSALATGFYPDGTVIHITRGKQRGRWMVRKSALVKIPRGY